MTEVSSNLVGPFRVQLVYCDACLEILAEYQHDTTELEDDNGE